MVKTLYITKGFWSNDPKECTKSLDELTKALAVNSAIKSYVFSFDIHSIKLFTNVMEKNKNPSSITIESFYDLRNLMQSKEGVELFRTLLETFTDVRNLRLRIRPSLQTKNEILEILEGYLKKNKSLIRIDIELELDLDLNEIQSNEILQKIIDSTIKNSHINLSKFVLKFSYKSFRASPPTYNKLFAILSKKKTIVECYLPMTSFNPIQKRNIDNLVKRNQLIFEYPYFKDDIIIFFDILTINKKSQPWSLQLISLINLSKSDVAQIKLNGQYNELMEGIPLIKNSQN